MERGARRAGVAAAQARLQLQLPPHRASRGRSARVSERAHDRRDGEGRRRSQSDEEQVRRHIAAKCDRDAEQAPRRQEGRSSARTPSATRIGSMNTNASARWSWASSRCTGASGEEHSGKSAAGGPRAEPAQGAVRGEPGGRERDEDEQVVRGNGAERPCQERCWKVIEDLRDVSGPPQPHSGRRVRLVRDVVTDERDLAADRTAPGARPRRGGRWEAESGAAVRGNRPHSTTASSAKPVAATAPSIRPRRNLFIRKTQPLASRFATSVLRTAPRILPIPGWFPVVVERLHPAVAGDLTDVVIVTHGVKMRLDLRDYIQRRIFYESHEPHQLAFCERFVDRGTSCSTSARM